MGAETIALLVAHSGTDGQPREWKMKLSGIDWDRPSRDYLATFEL